MLEYLTRVPTPPQDIRVDGQTLSFEPPQWDGGGRILEYRVWTTPFMRPLWHAIVSVVYIPACFLIQFIYKVHLKSVDGDSWVVFKHVPVLYLSEWPKLEENFFGDLKGEYIVSAENHWIINMSAGKFILQVVARNRVGCSPSSDTILVDLKGIPVNSILLWILLHLANLGTQALNSNLSIVEELEPAYSTTWEEHIFIGDHNDAPKVAVSYLPPI